MSVLDMSSPPKYTLTYFNYRGGGEIIRLLFAVGKTPYTDERLEKAVWLSRKQDMPMKNLPVLTIIDGNKEIAYCQSGAIARYLAKKFDLYGNTDEETLLIDEVYDSVGDVRKKFTLIHFETDETRKKEAERKLKEEDLPKFYSYIEKRKEQFGQKGFLTGNKLTLADLAVFNMVDSSLQMGHDVWTAYPALLEHRDLVKENPFLKKWLDSRPVTYL